MKLQTLKESETDALVSLWNRAAPFDRLTRRLFEEKTVGDADFADEQTVVVSEDGRPIAFGVGVVREKAESRCGYLKLFAVDPAWRGLGHGRLVAETIEGLLRNCGACRVRVGESAPNYLIPGVDVRYTQAMLLLEDLGYQQVGETYNLSVDLVGQDFDSQKQTDKLAEHGVTIRRAEASDRDLIRGLLQEHWPPWQGEVNVGMSNDPPSVHLAVAGEEVVGFAAYDTNNLGTGWFGPMGTRPQQRGLGIGGILLRRCLSDMRQSGLEKAVIPWVGPIRFYARNAGAVIDRVFHRFEKAL